MGVLMSDDKSDYNDFGCGIMLLLFALMPFVVVTAFIESLMNRKRGKQNAE